MFQKVPLHKVNICPVYPWTEQQMRVDPGAGNRVYFDDVSCKDILKLQLDVDACNLETMLKNGVTLDPAMVGRMLNVTDSFDIERYNTNSSLKLYNYLRENEDKIKDSLREDFEKRMNS